MAAKIAQVIVSINHNNVDKPFSYIIPEFLAEKVKKGTRVIVPFGKNNRAMEGYVIDIAAEFDLSYDINKLKSIVSLPDKRPMFNEDMIELAHWMKDKYYSTLSECLRCIMPSGVSLKRDTTYVLNPVIDTELTALQQEIVDFLVIAEVATKADIIAKWGESAGAALTSLVKKKIVIKNEKSFTKDFVQTVKFAYINRESTEDLQGLVLKKTKQSQVIAYLLKNGECPVKQIRDELKITDSPIHTLFDKQIVLFKEVEIRRQTVSPVTSPSAKPPTLTQEQKHAVDTISNYMDAGDIKPVLIHGVTGSGKTEIYLRLIEKVLDEGKQAIVLVPEISLTPQTVGRFKARFGKKISVTHSRLSQAERFDQWKNAEEGKISVMIGPRSALFTPFANLGIIVIDEEHENTYKSETSPKYDARHVAIKRAELTGAIVILGSATPGVDSYFLAEQGIYHLIEMNTRVNSSMPQIDIVDMRKELVEGNRSIFSKQLQEAIAKNLEIRLQTILFLNRRGHSTFVSCRQCGYVVKCDDCNINFTYHLWNEKMICHYCGKHMEPPKNCPQCGSKYIKFFGVGTQKVEDEIKTSFPKARVLRMDMDTTSKKHSHERILDSFRRRDADILIGTQMIAKGLDFPKVTVVGIVAADISLNQGDFRSGENTFQLLTQVAGRAGRAEHTGRVFIQTYNPEHYAVQYAKTNNYAEFYTHEIALRRQMNYPPYGHVFTSLFTGENEKKIIQSLFRLSDIMKQYNTSGDFELLGPSPAFISKIKKRYRWKLIVKCIDEVRLKNFVLYCVDKLRHSEDCSDIIMNLTLDPAVSV